MKLVSLQIFPRGDAGLGSTRLLFAPEVTQLYGPNGSGKTPTVQSIVFCLGYPVKFRSDIYARCAKAVLEVKVKSACYTLTRNYSYNFEVEVTEPAGNRQQFFNEKDYSEYLFDLLDLPFPTLVSVSNAATTPYMASVLPFFYLDQDGGYGAFYSPPSSFIKDQHAEILRLLCRLPCKHSFDAKKDLLAAKRELDQLDALVLDRRRTMDTASANSEGLSTVDDLTTSLTQLRAELDNLQQTGVASTAAVAAIEQLIGDRRRVRRDLEIEVAEINKRAANMTQIIGEIEAEVATLNLNEEAKRVFSSFNEICGVSGCGLFLFSSESYAKNLLYLRDQIKDLERNSSNALVRREALLDHIHKEKASIEDLEEQRIIAASGTVAASTRTAIDALTSRVLDLEMRKRDAERLELLRRRFAEATEQRDKSIDKVEALTSAVEMTPSLVRLRASMKDALQKWMDILKTNNVSSEIRFKDDFVPVFGGESLAQLTGSTKVRVVLAYHAAVLQILAENGDAALRFFILDTPKQHEMHDIDLTRYIDELKSFAHRNTMQIVFSATSYKHEGDDRDTKWLPSFQGERQDMFLGTA